MVVGWADGFAVGEKVAPSTMGPVVEGLAAGMAVGYSRGWYLSPVHVRLYGGFLAPSPAAEGYGLPG